MNDRTNRTVICSVAFLDIVDYSKRVGQEQLALKTLFNSLISEVVKDIATNDRVLIDTGDGAALCFMGDPEDALFVSMGLRDRLRAPACEAIGLTVRIGINLGPVRMITDINNHQNVIGDGINVAQRVMSFAEPNQIMVSRTYFEVVSRLSQEFTKLFHYAGARTDKHVREHEIYEVGAGQEESATAIAEEALAGARSSFVVESRTASARPATPQPRELPPSPPREPPPPPPREPPPAPRSKERPNGSGTTSANGGVITAMGAFSGTVATETAAEHAERTTRADAPPPAKRGKSLSMVAVAVVVAAGVVAFAAMQFKSRTGDATRVDATTAPAADVAASAAPAQPGPAKSDAAMTTPSAPAADPAATAAKADSGLAAPAVKTDAGSSAPRAASAGAAPTKSDASVSPSANATVGPAAPAAKSARVASAPPDKAHADAKTAAAKGGATPPSAAGAPPAGGAMKPAKPELAQKDDAKKSDARKDAAAKSGAVAATGKVEFWITPFGDVFVDGKALGSSPPLKVYDLPAGTHRIEIYNDSAGFPHKETVEVKDGELRRVTKTFR